MPEQEKFTRCLRCNRKLRTPLAQIRGYGPLCWSIHNKELDEKNHLFSINEEKQKCSN